MMPRDDGPGGDRHDVPAVAALDDGAADGSTPPAPPPFDATPPAGRGRGAVLFGVGFALIVSAWLLGVVARVAQREAPALPPSDLPAPDQFGLYGEAWDYVNQEFFGDRPAPAAITDGAVEGMVEALDDPWAMVSTPEADGGAAAGADGAADAPAAPASDAADGDDPLSPTYVGPLGVWIVATSRGARILAVEPDSPAAAAELAAGDLIVRAQNGPLADDGAVATPVPTATPADASDDPVTSGDRAAPVAQSLADASEPAVEVVVSRRDTTLFARTLERRAEGAAAVPAAATAALDGTVLRIRLHHLLPGAADALDAALDAAGDAGAAGGIVLDVRDNPGGSRAELARIAGRFLRGPVWIEVDADGDETVHEAEGPADLAAPLVVLTNGGTHDEAEMLAAALRDARQARLVGEPSYGHGTLQSSVRAGRLVLRLTTGTWRSPAGTALDEAGLAPDVEVAGRSEQDAAALRLAGGAAEASAPGQGG